MTPHDLMGRALELAARARGETRPNPCVGCVIVAADGAVVGEGWHRRAGQPHAEVEALNDARAAGREVRGATAYVTLEPCNHHGRTGPCSEALVAAGIARVVVAMRDPNVEARGGVERLRAAGIAVEVGLRGDEARRLNAPFVTFHELGRPLITLKWAMTLDGCTAVPGGDSKWITGEAARAEVHRRRATQDAVLAGIGTVLADGSRLTARDVPTPPGPLLLRIVLDSALRLPPDAPFIREGHGSPALVACREDAAASREAALREAGAEVLRLAPGPRGVSLPDLLFHLRARGVQSLTVEGGRAVAGSFLASNLADRVEAWIAPRLAGGGGALGPVALPNPLSAMAQARALHEVQVTPHGPDWLVEGWLEASGGGR